MVHPGSLHGGAPVDADFPSRHTLVFRFFADDATLLPLPDHGDSGYTPGGVLFLEVMAPLKAGDPLRAPSSPCDVCERLASGWFQSDCALNRSGLLASVVLNVASQHTDGASRRTTWNRTGVASITESGISSRGPFPLTTILA